MVFEFTEFEGGKCMVKPMTAVFLNNCVKFRTSYAHAIPRGKC